MLRNRIRRLSVAVSLVTVGCWYITDQSAFGAQAPQSAGKSMPAPGKTPPVPGKTPPVPGKGLPWQATDEVEAKLGPPPQAPAAPPQVPDFLADDRP